MTDISTSTAHPHNTAMQSFARLAAYTGQMLSEAAQRRKIRISIAQLPEKYLRDIGLTRHDVSSIAHLPLPFSSTLELSQTARRRAGNW